VSGRAGVGSVWALRSQAAGGSRPRAVPEVLRCDVSITSEAGPERASTGLVLAARRLGRCALRSAGAWYDQRGVVAAHTCAERRELAGDLLQAGMPRGRKLDWWLSASVRWSPAQPVAPPGPAYQLTVALEGVYPPVWRRVPVPAGISLTGLHDVVQVAMGWEGHHMWRFGMLACGDVRGEHDPATALDVVLRQPGDRVGYVYDFGDLWVHHIELDKVITRSRAALPRCTAGNGRARRRTAAAVGL
jgi:Plasmid pRiA4b ORF-3-like protein